MLNMRRHRRNLFNIRRVQAPVLRRRAIHVMDGDAARHAQEPQRRFNVRSATPGDIACLHHAYRGSRA
jgi:hypothetical protein